MPNIRLLLVDPGSPEWFIRYMRLRNIGVVPTVTPTEFLPSRRAMAAFWGPKASTGWTFHDHGSPEYENYVRQLLMRVLQIQWPADGILPFQFARGVMAEAVGMDVSWAEFAYLQTHTRIPRILPEYRDLNSPLPRLPVVLPNKRIEVCSNHNLRFHSTCHESGLDV